MTILLDVDSLPKGFEYPRQFIRLVELGLTNLEPWYVLDGEELWNMDDGLKTRYPRRVLVPFARRQDNDDIACWEPSAGEGVVVIVHDFASPGWEDRGSLKSVNDWLRQAIEDLIEFE